jgi:repressor LexA
MQMDIPLTRRQEAIVTLLRERADAFEHPPTLDELCRALGLRSRGSLHKHIRALVDAGLVEPMDHKQRGIRLTQAGGMEGALPLMGYIAAGKPIEAVADTRAIDVPPALRSGRDCYVLQVKGTSMIEDGILDGDWVVVEPRSQARNGEIVVALIDGTEVTLKRILLRPREVVLYPANSSMEPLHYSPERIQIQGVVVGQMRSYR